MHNETQRKAFENSSDSAVKMLRQQLDQMEAKAWLPQSHMSVHTLALSPPNYLILVFTHLKLCLANAIHNFKWVKIIQIWLNGVQLF